MAISGQKYDNTYEGGSIWGTGGVVNLNLRREKETGDWSLVLKINQLDENRKMARDQSGKIISMSYTLNVFNLPGLIFKLEKLLKNEITVVTESGVNKETGRGIMLEVGQYQNGQYGLSIRPVSNHTPSNGLSVMFSNQFEDGLGNFYSTEIQSLIEQCRFAYGVTSGMMDGYMDLYEFTKEKHKPYSRDNSNNNYGGGGYNQGGYNVGGYQQPQQQQYGGGNNFQQNQAPMGQQQYQQPPQQPQANPIPMGNPMGQPNTTPPQTNPSPVQEISNISLDDIEGILND